MSEKRTENDALVREETPSSEKEPPKEPFSEAAPVTGEPSEGSQRKKKIRKPKGKNLLFSRTRRSAKLLFGDIKYLIEFEFLFRTLCLVVFFPLLTYMERSILLVNKMSNMAMYNVTSSVKNPFTWIILILMVLAVVFFSMIEQGGLVSAIHAAHCGRKLGVREIFSDGFDFAVDHMKPKNWMLAVYIMVVLPTARIFDNTSINRFFVMPGFITEYIDKIGWLSFAAIVFHILMMIVNLCWIFVFTVMEIEKKSFREATRRSVQTLKINGVKEFILIAVGYMLALLILIVLMTIFVCFSWFLLCKWLEPGMDWDNIFSDTAISIIVTANGIIFMWITVVLFQVVVQDYYYRACDKEKIEIPQYEKHPHYFGKMPVRLAIIAVSAVTIYFSVPARYRQFKWMMNTSAGETMIMAHRGYSQIAPENTIPAFEAAYEAGVKAVELDVQMLKDGTIIVMHDDNFARTCGVNKNVWDVTYEEVKTYDAGKKFSAEFAGTKVPTLDEVIKACKGRLFINIEIKRSGHDEGIEKAVVDIIRANDFVDSCDVTSQDYHTLELVREANPDVLTAYTTVIGLGNIETLDAASIISIQQTFATFENVERLHRSGKRVFVWTVNSESEMERLISLNVDAILTNDPHLGQMTLEMHQGFADTMSRLNEILRYF